MDFNIERTSQATATSVFQQKFARLQEMAPQLYRALGLNNPNAKPTMQFVDATIVAAKGGLSAVSTYDDLIASDDAIQRPGADTKEITDLNEGKLPKDQFFMITDIQLQFASSVDGSGTKVGAADWGLIPAKLRNGQIEILQQGRVIVPEISMEKFYNPHLWVRTASDDQTYDAANTFTVVPKGTGIYHLDNPKVLFPEEKIDVNMRFGAALTSNDAIKIVFKGIKTYRIG